MIIKIWWLHVLISLEGLNVQKNNIKTNNI